MSSSEKLLPQTNAFSISFLLNKKTKSYDASFYNPMQTNNKANQNEIKQVLTDLENAQKPFSKKTKKAFHYYLLSLAISIVITVALVALADSNHPQFIPIISVVSFIALFGKIWLFSREKEKLANEATKECQKLIDKANQELFSSRGLRWILPIQFPSYVELWKDYEQGHLTV